MKQFSLIMLLFCAVFSAKAQIDIQVFKPKQLHKSTLANVATEKMPKVDVATILAEEEKEKTLKGENKGVFVFGKQIDVKLNLDNSGTWIDTPKGRVWKLIIHSPKALSINLAFDKFRLPAGANLLIYNQDSSMVMGPITSVVNNERNAIATDLLSGDMTILELFEPIAQKGKTQLSIAKVVHGYKDALNHQHPIEISNGRTENYNSSASCNRDVVCEPTWSTESNGVVKITVLDISYSGALINDACQSWKPFFLTAKHALDLRGVNQTQTWSVFTFRYRRTQCNNTSEAEPTGLFTLNGCTVRASWADTDFALYEVNLSNQGYSVFSLQARNIHYLGWTRSTATPTSGASLHHPNGDVMKIALTNNITPSTQFSVNVWRAVWYSGITADRSSGGPLFDQNKRIIGQLLGGLSSCTNPQGSDTFGRFDLSWNGGGTPSTRLKDWLDPDNINPQFTNTALAGSSAVNPNTPSSSLLSVSGQGMTVTSSGLALAPIYNGSLITSSPNSQGILQAEWQSLSSSVYVS